jgi:flavin-dependent dehydrogenase
MKTQVAIIGGGPAGSTSAMFLAREGIQSAIIEKDTFPRYHVGESMTGECGSVARALGLEQEMLKRQYPIKYGVRVMGSSSWFVPVMQRTPEGELKDQFTWQMRRSDFDKLLLDEAQAHGATLIQGKASKPIIAEDGTVKGLTVDMADGGTLEIESEMLLDCSGQSTWLANQGGVTGPKYIGNYDRQMAVFSQVVGGIRDSGGPSRENHPDNTLIFYKRKYHWGWWIPIDSEAVSVGIVSPAAYFVEQKESKKDFITRELGSLHPDLTRRLPEIKLVEEARAIKNYSYQVKNFTGKGFMCLGDAHRFLDPIFSFGLYVAMKEAQLAAPIVRDYLNGARRDTPKPFADFQLYAEKGIDVLEDALDGFWEHPLAFAWLVHARYREYMVDVFAGRIYENQPSPATTGFRNLLKRDRSYDDQELYSIPIGSRYHPERAPIWVADSEDINELEATLEKDA